MEVCAKEGTDAEGGLEDDPVKDGSPRASASQKAASVSLRVAAAVDDSPAWSGMVDV